MPLKITKEDYQRLSEIVTAYDTDERWYQYCRDALSFQRYAFDCLYKGGGTSFVVYNLYKYIDDDHILSALKRILKHRYTQANEILEWGSEFIPKDQWIDPTKEYTCGGHRVIGLHIKLHNSCAEEVTYPVKGSVVLREKPIKLDYRIWSLDGRADVCWGKGDNLVLADCT